VVTIDGEVVARSKETVNPNLPTGEIEVRAVAVTVQSAAAELPMPVFGEQGLSGGDPAYVPLPRFEARTGSRQHHAALGGHRIDSAAD